MDSIERMAVDPRADDVVVLRPGHVEYRVVERNDRQGLVVERHAVRQRTPAMEERLIFALPVFTWYDLVMGCAVSARPAQ